MREDELLEIFREKFIKVIHEATWTRLTNKDDFSVKIEQDPDPRWKNISYYTLRYKSYHSQFMQITDRPYSDVYFNRAIDKAVRRIIWRMFTNAIKHADGTYTKKKP